MNNGLYEGLKNGLLIAIPFWIIVIVLILALISK